MEGKKKKHEDNFVKINNSINNERIVLVNKAKTLLNSEEGNLWQFATTEWSLVLLYTQEVPKVIMRRDEEDK